VVGDEEEDGDCAQAVDVRAVADVFRFLGRFDQMLFLG
jgi:hypothetical protein